MKTLHLEVLCLYKLVETLIFSSPSTFPPGKSGTQSFMGSAVSLPLPLWTRAPEPLRLSGSCSLVNTLFGEAFFPLLEPLSTLGGNQPRFLIPIGLGLAPSSLIGGMQLAQPILGMLLTGLLR